MQVSLTGGPLAVGQFGFKKKLKPRILENLPYRGTGDHRGPKVSLPSSGIFTDSTTKSLYRCVLARPCYDR